MAFTLADFYREKMTKGNFSKNIGILSAQKCLFAPKIKRSPINPNYKMKISLLNMASEFM